MAACECSEIHEVVSAFMNQVSELRKDKGMAGATRGNDGGRTRRSALEHQKFEVLTGRGKWQRFSMPRISPGVVSTGYLRQ